MLNALEHTMKVGKLPAKMHIQENIINILKQITDFVNIY